MTNTIRERLHGSVARMAILLTERQDPSDPNTGMPAFNGILSQLAEHPLWDSTPMRRGSWTTVA